MFELKYSITENDLRAENKHIMLFYFALYAAVAAVGLAVGIVATVLRPMNSLFVLGIILIVLAGILMLCALFIAIAPKNFVTSAFETSDTELDVKVDKHGITVNGENICPFADISRLKRRKSYMLAYVAKDKVFIIKNTVGDTEFRDLYAYMDERKGRILLTDGKSDESVPNSEDGTVSMAYQQGASAMENGESVNDASASEGDDKVE